MFLFHKWSRKQSNDKLILNFFSVKVLYIIFMYRGNFVFEYCLKVTREHFMTNLKAFCDETLNTFKDHNV